MMQPKVLPFSLGKLRGNLYSRFSNPNTDEFASKIAALEGVESAVATASGMNAMLRRSQHI